MDTKKITTQQGLNVAVSLPGSKSYSHRYLVAAGLADGMSVLYNVLDSEDVLVTINVLRGYGIAITIEHDLMAVYGNGGALKANGPISVGDSGTSARFALALTALNSGTAVIDGSQRMRQRPMHAMFSALNQLGCEVNGAPGGHLPATIRARGVKGGRVTVDCSQSSQFLSALLMIAPLLYRGLTITTTGDMVSRNYVGMTMAAMATFGVDERQHEHIFRVKGKQQYQSGTYTIETDATAASYFWAAAALTKGRVLVRNIKRDTLQGDIAFVDFLAQMGCKVEENAEGVAVSCDGRVLAIDADLRDTPDIAPTLAVVAAFAKGQSVLRNVAHLQYKECDRVAALIEGLAVMGINARFDGGDLYVEGGEPQGGRIDTRNDHRMAMSFAVAGLAAQGMEIENPGCVAKSFPKFWKVFEAMGKPAENKEQAL